MTSLAPMARRALPAVRVSRIEFSASAAGRVGQRQFTQPRRMEAWEVAAAMESVAAGNHDSPGAPDSCFVIFVPRGASREDYTKAKAILVSSAQADGAGTVVVARNAETIEWRPGLAVLQGLEESRQDMTKALMDFSFYDGELRALERAVEALEEQAEIDVALAHRVHHRNREHWARMVEQTEHCARMRLTSARLEPQMYAFSRALPAAARRWVFRLFQKSGVEPRLEALNDRLEALEELYQNAHQRISEYRWYREGHLLEMGIILLLLVECTLMCADILARARDR